MTALDSLPLLATSAAVWPSPMQAAYVIISLVIIEGLLSVDNAMGIASLAGRLETRERNMAMRLGFIAAYGFRVVALFFASWIIQNTWLRWLGAIYLIYLMCAEVAGHKAKDEDGDGKGEPVTFWPTVWKIGLMDLSLSVDNVIAAIAFSPNNIYLVYLGVLIGIIALRFLAGWCIKLIQTYPLLEKTAFLLVGFVGILLVIEESTKAHLGPLVKFSGILVILGLSFAYMKKPAVQRAVDLPGRPVLAVMRFFALIVESPFSLVKRLFRPA